MVESTTALKGIDAIAKYARLDRTMVRRLSKNSSFPARKVGRAWYSDTLAIDEWRRAYLKTPVKGL